METKKTYELDTNCKSAETAMRRFEKKFPEAWLSWGEMIADMFRTGEDAFVDNRNADGTAREWEFALHAEFDGEHAYICVIEREPETERNEK